MARWLNMVELNCADASKAKEFVEWYENIHLADILETPGYLNGRLYEKKEYREGRGQFLTLYEIETDDIDETIAFRREKRKREREQGRYRDVFVVLWRDIRWRQIIERDSSQELSEKGERWVNLVENNLVTPSLAGQFIDWYERVHLPDILENPGFLRGGLYERSEFVGGRGQFLTIYHLETDNIDRTMSLRRESRAREREKGHYRPVEMDGGRYLFMPVWRDVIWKLMFERNVSQQG